MRRITFTAALRPLARGLGLQRAYFDSREYLRSKFESPDLSAEARLGVLFVHVPKCAGTSIAAQMPIWHGHRSAQYFRWRDPALFARSFKFGFARNPYDRFASAFHYLRSDGVSARDAAWARRNLGAYADFAEFVRALERRSVRNRVCAWLHFLPQCYFLCDSANRVIVDYVGKTERFQEGIEAINRRSDLGLKNETRRAGAHGSYASFYDERSADLIRDIYAEDFRAFGYPRTIS